MLSATTGSWLASYRRSSHSSRDHTALTGLRRRVFDRAAESIGLAGLTPHELRHTAASLAVAEGANAKAVQRMLGHASAAMTLDVYADLFEDDLDQVADRLDRAAGRAAADSVRTESVGPDLDAVRPDRRQHG
ncbi:tyrosine-type recombinase/integrase [Micromonospora sp. A202]|uniref:tyrosine-type recombinase/integrase n=1 Tax=Micromonospora sp. A202 TaxID=2572899 RepID=UPI002105F6EE|nr:tyrosine-type recombinase/integrase [Micromonospora sp. A202]